MVLWQWLERTASDCPSGQVGGLSRVEAAWIWGLACDAFHSTTPAARMRSWPVLVTVHDQMAPGEGPQL